MFPFPADSPYPFEKPLHNHHEASLPFPPPKLDASSPLFPLSPPFFDHELLNDLSLLAPPPQISPPSPPPPAPFRTEGPSTHKNAVAALPTKASCASTATAAARKVLGSGGRRLRKDRHSKICTAQGPRDRRMRLSLDVARKFFDLQDLLGFDKASKTVDWLLTSCKASIMELTGSCSPLAHLNASAGGDNAKSESSTSECEVLSTSTNTTPAAPAARRAAVRRPRKDTAPHPAPSRESRVMARARARERTREKRMRPKGFDDDGQKRQPVFSSSPLEAAGEEFGTHTTRSSLELGQPSFCSPDRCKKSSGASPPAVITGGYDPISIFDYGQNIVHNGDSAIGFVQEHWGVQSSGNVEEQRLLLADAQLQHWLWEAFNPSI